MSQYDEILQCLREQKLQIEKMSSNDENENNELENMIVEVRVVKQKHDSNVRKTF